MRDSGPRDCPDSLVTWKALPPPEGAMYICDCGHSRVLTLVDYSLMLESCDTVDLGILRATELAGGQPSQEIADRVRARVRDLEWQDANLRSRWFCPKCGLYLRRHFQNWQVFLADRRPGCLFMVLFGLSVASRTMF